MNMKFLNNVRDFNGKSEDVLVSTQSGDIVIKGTDDLSEIKVAMVSDTYIDGRAKIVSAYDDLNLTLSQNFRGNLKLETISGKIFIRNFQGKELTIKANNGRIRIYNSITGSLVIKSANGKVDCENIVSDQLKINAANGTISVDHALVRNGNLDSKNGSISINRVASSEFLSLMNDNGDINGYDTAAKSYLVSTKDGDIDLERITFDEARFESINGDINLTIVKCGEKKKIQSLCGDTNVAYVKSR